MKICAIVAVVLVLLGTQASAGEPISVVAAENFYGDVAGQIGGPLVEVTSVLSNPDQDPHLFEASPSVARALSGARIVVYNGIDYDPWMEDLLDASESPERITIVVADLIGKTTGDNPHIWYDPSTMVAFARAMCDALVVADPSNRAEYGRRLAAFEESMVPIQNRIAELKDRSAGTPATATEPVFGYMFEALGMDVKDQSFQLAVMNDTEPSASDIAAFEESLRTHQVKFLVYNNQATDPLAERMLEIAESAGVPVVGASETEPPGMTYQAWMTSELDSVDKALPVLTQ